MPFLIADVGAAGLIPLLASAATAAIASAGTADGDPTPPAGAMQDPPASHITPEATLPSDPGRPLHMPRERQPQKQQQQQQQQLDLQQQKQQRLQHQQQRLELQHEVVPRGVRMAVEVVAALELCVTEPRLAEYLSTRSAAGHAAAAVRLLVSTLIGTPHASDVRLAGLVSSFFDTCQAYRKWFQPITTCQ